MIASLYQNGSSSSRKPSAKSSISLVSPDDLLFFQNVCRHLARPQLYVISGALPSVARPGQQVDHHEGMPYVNSQLVHRQFQKSGLFPHGIEIHDRHDDVAFIRCAFAVTDDLIVIDGMKS